MPSLTTYRRAVAAALNDFFLGIAVSGSTTVVAVQTLITGDTTTSLHKYDLRWIYNKTKAQQRQVLAGSYLTASGTLGVSTPWTAVTAGDEIELTAMFPSALPPFALDTSYNTLIAAAMRRINIQREITVPITLLNRLSLSTWSAWIHPDRVVSVREPSPTGTTLIDASWRRPRVIVTGDSAVLELRTPFGAASGSLTLEVVSPAYSWINNVESTAGLVAEADTSPVEIDDMVKATLVEAYQALMSRSPSFPSGPHEAQWVAQQGIAAKIALYDFGAAQPPAPQQQQQGQAA